MGWDVLLAAASGGLTAVSVWWLLARNMAQDAQQLSRRIRQISQGPEAQQASQNITLSSRSTRYSAVPLLGDMLARLALASRVLALLEQAGSRLSVGAFLLSHAVAAFSLWMFACLFKMPALIGLGLFFAGGITPTVIMFSKRQARFLRMSGQLPDAIRLMSSAMRAGLGMEAGLNIVSQELQDPIREEFKKLLNEWRLYGDMNEAFLHMARRVTTADMRLFVASACLHRDVGGNFVEVLEQLEETIRNRFQLQRELKMLTAESRMSGMVLGALPILVAGGLYWLNPSYMHLLVEREIGRIMLWISIGMQVLGMIIIYWLTHPKIR